jgi:hypothetical protein
MKIPAVVLTSALVVASATLLVASGHIGIYGIVERVVFEPNEQTPQRLQVWGAFAFVDGGTSGAVAISEAEKGFLYFKLPHVGTNSVVDAPLVETVKREWADLKAVAGTGQAVGFGSWQYVGRFSALRPAVAGDGPPYVLENGLQMHSQTDLRVRPATESFPAKPSAYQTDSGVIKLSAEGSRGAIVQRLRDALKK